MRPTRARRRAGPTPAAAAQRGPGFPPALQHTACSHELVAGEIQERYRRGQGSLAATGNAGIDPGSHRARRRRHLVSRQRLGRHRRHLLGCEDIAGQGRSIGGDCEEGATHGRQIGNGGREPHRMDPHAGAALAQLHQAGTPDGHITVHQDHHRGQWGRVRRALPMGYPGLDQALQRRQQLLAVAGRRSCCAAAEEVFRGADVGQPGEPIPCRAALCRRQTDQHQISWRMQREELQHEAAGNRLPTRDGARHTDRTACGQIGHDRHAVDQPELRFEVRDPTPQIGHRPVGTGQGNAAARTLSTAAEPHLQEAGAIAAPRPDQRRTVLHGALHVLSPWMLCQADASLCFGPLGHLLPERLDGLLELLAGLAELALGRPLGFQGGTEHHQRAQGNERDRCHIAGDEVEHRPEDQGCQQRQPWHPLRLRRLRRLRRRELGRGEHRLHPRRSDDRHSRPASPLGRGVKPHDLQHGVAERERTAHLQP